MSTVSERFLRYVSFDTQSDPESPTCPSTEKQKVLGAALVEEMLAMGIAELGHHIEVAVIGFDKFEQAGAVHAFAAGKNFFQISYIVDNKVQSLQAAVAGGILKVDVTDLVIKNEFNDVTLGEILGIFADFCGNAADVVVSFHFLPRVELKILLK